MEQNEQPHTAHDGSTSPVHLSPSPPATADVGTPTKGRYNIILLPYYQIITSLKAIYVYPNLGY